MRFNFGKYQGKTITRVMVDDPLYIGWCLRKLSRADVLGEIRDAMRVFDAKPFVAGCCGPSRCGNAATRITMYASSYGGVNTEPYYWCDECDPCSLGAPPYRLMAVRTYEEMVLWAYMHDVGKKETRELVRGMARAKGAPKKLTQETVEELFGGRGCETFARQPLKSRSDESVRAALA